MRTSTRNLLCVGTSLASLAVGVIGARAIRGDGEVAPIGVGLADSPQLIEGDVALTDDQVYPLLEPVTIGDDPAILERLLEGPPDIADDALGPEIGRPGSDDSPAVGAVSGSPGGSGTPGAVPIDGTLPPGETLPADEPVPLDIPFYFDPAIGGIFGFPEHAFDLCAGREPGSPLPEYCPAGYAGTLSGGNLPPAPFMWGTPGHYTTVTADGFPEVCPAVTPSAGAGQAAITTWSVTPLQSLLVEWRPYRTTQEWRSLTVEPANDAEQESRWTARLETEPFDRDTWGLLPRCFAIERDASLSYDVRFTAVDIYSREVPANPLILPGNNPGGRPPTEARVIGVRPFAEVASWTKPEGSVVFTSKVLTDYEDRECGYELAAPGGVHSAPGLASPVGVFDPAFSKKVFASVQLPEAGLVLLCATIYDTRNTLRPLSVDKMLLRAKTAQRPVITLEAVKLADGITIDHFRLSATIQFPGDRYATDDGCSQSWTNSTDISGIVAVNEPLWDCTSAPLPVDTSGYVKVPVTITRTVYPTRSTVEYRREAWGIQIQVDRCADNACPPRPTEWYQIPLPAAGSALCGRSFWESDAPCPQPQEGVAIVKVEYPVIEGAPGDYGTAELVSTTDRPITDPTDTEPTVGMLTSSVGAAADFGALPATVTVVSNRPITLTSIDVFDIVGDGSAQCARRDVPVGGAPATEWDVAFEVCAGTTMFVQAHITDAEGIAYIRNLGIIDPPGLVSNSLHSTIEFLGGDLPQFGWIYDFEMLLDGQSPTTYGWYNWTGSRGSGASCISLDNGVAQTYGADPRIEVRGGELNVRLRFLITTVGETDCPTTAASGAGPIELTGSFSASQIAAGEPLVLRTSPDAALQIRVTLTGRFLLDS